MTKRTEHRDGTKPCSTCREWKPLEAFGQNRTRWDGLRQRCRACEAQAHQRLSPAARERRRLYAQTYRAQYPDRRKDARLRWKFGITLAAYQALLEEQAGGCAICGRTDAPLVVDHRHSDGAVRALLCSDCNCGLGLFDERVALLQAAIRYVRKHNLGDEEVERDAG